MSETVTVSAQINLQTTYIHICEYKKNKHTSKFMSYI